MQSKEIKLLAAEIKNLEQQEKERQEEQEKINAEEKRKSRYYSEMFKAIYNW